MHPGEEKKKQSDGFLFLFAVFLFAEMFHLRKYLHGGILLASPQWQNIYVCVCVGGGGSEGGITLVCQPSQVPFSQEGCFYAFLSATCQQKFRMGLF